MTETVQHDIPNNALANGGAVQTLPPVVVNMERMTIGDLALLDEFREMAQQRKAGKKADIPLGRMIAFLDRVVDGGVTAYPASMLPKVIERVSESFKDMMTETTGGDDPEKN